MATGCHTAIITASPESTTMYKVVRSCHGLRKLPTRYSVSTVRSIREEGLEAEHCQVQARYLQLCPRDKHADHNTCCDCAVP